MRITCQICGDEFQAQHARPHGDHCEECAGWLRALTWGPYQEHEANYEKLGMTIAYLVRKGDLKEKDFIRGLIKGIRKP